MTALLGFGAICFLMGFAALFVYGLTGILLVQPRTQVVVLRFGRYSKTLTQEGINYFFPLGRKLYRVSSQDTSVDVPRTTVLDSQGNPIQVAAVCVYRVREAHNAVLRVHSYPDFVYLLANVVVKGVCSRFPYESKDPTAACLKKESPLIAKALVEELQALVRHAGIEVLQLRLSDLAYAPEIAQSMLLRQQAEALVAARRKIVEGAVATMGGAMERMEEVGLGLPPDMAESLSANLMLVLCSGERVQAFMPIRVAGGEGKV
ncbi:MAG: hypothetical protein KC416_07490 [Myxococcales bacterium]|nr:hypothetical protein [Myxococcales bacterium]